MSQTQAIRSLGIRLQGVLRVSTPCLLMLASTWVVCSNTKALDAGCGLVIHPYRLHNGMQIDLTECSIEFYDTCTYLFETGDTFHAFPMLNCSAGTFTWAHDGQVISSEFGWTSSQVFHEGGSYSLTVESIDLSAYFTWQIAFQGKVTGLSELNRTNPLTLGLLDAKVTEQENLVIGVYSPSTTSVLLTLLSPDGRIEYEESLRLVQGEQHIRIEHPCRRERVLMIVVTDGRSRAVLKTML